MFKIGIIEIDRSNHSVANLCKYANPSVNDVLLFTSNNLLKPIQEELGQFSNKVTIYCKKDNQTYLSFIRFINNKSRHKFDFIIINTITRWEFLFLKTGCTTISYIYSINFWFNDINESFFGRLKRFNINRLNLMSFLPLRFHANPIWGPIIRRRIIYSLDGYLVEYPNFKNYINNFISHSKKVHFLSKKYFISNINTTKCDIKTSFVITGMITDLRRSYIDVIESFEKLPNYLLKRSRLTLLGRPIGNYGKTIIQKLINLEFSGLDIMYFEEYVSHDVFSDILSKCDIIIAPIKFEYKSGLINERFTYTKGTGTFADMIQFAKPTIVPVEYNIASEFKKCFITYSDEADLLSIISELIINTDKLEQVKKEAYEIISKYNLKYMQKQLDKIIHQYIKNNK